MVQACRAAPNWTKFTATCLGWGFAADGLAIEISRKLHGRPVDRVRLPGYIEAVVAMLESLERGELARESAAFDTDSLVAGQLFTQWEAAVTTSPVLGERSPREVADLLGIFDQLEGNELSWLQQFLSAVGELMTRLGP